jgi:ubiquinone/menaquinone biosynthesis C-methylase UbiE
MPATPAALAASTPPDATIPNPYAEIARAFDVFATEEERWRRRNRTYHDQVERVATFHVPPGQTVLEIGCGSGDLLAALEPSVGVGVDVSAGMVAAARERHPELRIVHSTGEELDLGETFDTIVLSDLLPFVHDLQALFDSVARHSRPRTRIVINTYNRAWRPIIAAAELLGLKPRKPIRNWVSLDDVANLLGLAGFEVLMSTSRVLLPKKVPFLTMFLNGFLANIWPFKNLGLMHWIVARQLPVSTGEESVSVVIPCRNEAGHVPELVRRLPQFGSALEVIWVEGNSTDDTRAAIERVIADNPQLDMRLLVQPGKGKGDAVRTGFAAAKHDVLMILDGDVSVLPEDLPKFYRVLVDGRGEFINGSRLVYDMEPGSMRFLNVLGNKLFSRLFKGVTGQHVKDTLCGTKVLRRSDYEKIAAGRSYFGDFDPFGDFDLLFGASKLGLKVVDLPVRYHPRTYGTTNISRFRHGLLLFRMTVFAFWKFRVAIFRPRPAAE